MKLKQLESDVKKMTRISIVTAILLAGSLSTASASTFWRCDGDLVKVSGSVNTENVNAYSQTGKIELFLKSTEEGENKSFAGTINGYILESTGVRSVLSHTIEFDNGDRLYTNNDVAIALLPPLETEKDGTPCAFNVFEVISDISGTGEFSDVSGQILVNGSISFCSFNNNNSFTLSGTLCLAEDESH